MACGGTYTCLKGKGVLVVMCVTLHCVVADASMRPAAAAPSAKRATPSASNNQECSKLAYISLYFHI